MDMVGAEVPGHGYDENAVGCFDPRIVIQRFYAVFPTMKMDQQDHSRRSQAFFLWHFGDKGPRIAEADAVRRGPLWLFTLPVGNTVLEGKVERYAVYVTGRPNIPEPARTQIIQILKGLQFAPYVVVHESTPELFRCLDDTPVKRPPFWPTLPRLSLVVLRSKDIHVSAKFYYVLGLHLELEKHGDGPEHYAAILGPSVLEIYPDSFGESTKRTRIGFDVASIDRVLSELGASGILPKNISHVAGPKKSIVLPDPDGHQVHLTEVDLAPGYTEPDWITRKE
jgi:lactoylglutathione lyase